MKKLKEKYPWIMLIIMCVGITLFAALFGIMIMSFERPWSFKGDSGAWLGYWGGIIGSVVGIASAVYLSQREQIRSREKESQFLIVSLYLEKMELVQTILVDAGELKDDFDFDFKSLDDDLPSGEVYRLFNLLKDHYKMVARVKTYYSYFSGNDHVFINLFDEFEMLITLYSTYTLHKRTTKEEFERAFEQYTSKYDEVQGMVTKEITMTLIAIQSNYANPKDFVKD